LKTGSTLLDLACSGREEGGFFRGHFYYVVGDSASGKTFLSMTCLAEATMNKSFKDYRLILDDVEGGMLMDVGKFFGPRLAARLEPPSKDEDGQPAYSVFVEDFYANIADAFEEGKPFIYVLDSMDALTSRYDEQKFDEATKAYRKGEKPKGDYGDGKAKLNSRNLRRVIGRLRDTGSILIIVSQTRDNINAGLFEPRKTRSGGHALTFYATLELWSSIGSRIEAQIRGRKRTVGVMAKVRIRKNRLSGRDRTVVIPIYHSCGFDDVGGCVDYLLSEGVWKKNKSGVIKAVGLGPAIELHREKLVRELEKRELEADLKGLVVSTWKEVESACEIRRKSRYRE
jgi:RecA/RadA recombinase